MPKINLVKRKRQQQLRKKISSEGMVYIIRTTRNNKSYYVCSVEADTKTITWTPRREKSMVFHTESGTQHFIHTYMKHRTDIELIGTRSAHA